MLFQLLNRIRELLEYLGGVSDEAPDYTPNFLRGPLWWGLWWALLILIVLSFSGQTSKFIYIDF